jgi:hypothetical protein
MESVKVGIRGPVLARTIAQQVTGVLSSYVRNSGYGGTILVIPPEMVEQVVEENRYLSIEYRVTDESTGRRRLHIHLPAIRPKAQESD